MASAYKCDRCGELYTEKTTYCEKLNYAIDRIRDFCKAKKGRCIDCPAYLTFRIESGDTVQTCKFRCDAPVNWEHIDGCGREEDSLENQEPTKEAETKTKG